MSPWSASAEEYNVISNLPPLAMAAPAAALALLLLAGCAKDQPMAYAPVVRATQPVNPEELPVVQQQAVTKTLEDYRREIGEKWGQRLGVSAREFPVEQRAGVLGNLVADALYEELQEANIRPLDAVFINSGGIRTTVPEGMITNGKIAELLPFGNTVVFVEMNGQQVEQLARHLSESQGRNPISGMTIVGDREHRLLSVEIGGQPVQPQKTYTFATNSYLASGEGGFDFLPAMEQQDTGLLMRDLMTEHVAELDAEGKMLDRREPLNRYFFQEKKSSP